MSEHFSFSSRINNNSKNINEKSKLKVNDNNNRKILISLSNNDLSLVENKKTMDQIDKKFNDDNNSKDNNVNKNVYILEMRKAFTSKEMLNKDFTINQNYFKTKQGNFWNFENDTLLEKAINELGESCSIKKIKDQYLTISSESEIFLRKTSLLKYKKLIDILNNEIKL